MFDIDKYGGKLLAAVFSLAVSAVFFATAIIPASPNGVLV
ncbi:MAG: recombination protein F [Qipengyuania vulgaris]